LAPLFVFAQTEPTATTEAQREEGTPEPVLSTSTVDAEQTANELLVPQALSVDEQVEKLFERMSPEERVGQLFVIAFDGNDLSTTSDIAVLIHDYHIGGVMLIPGNENFTNAKGANTPVEIARITNQLQLLAYGYTLSQENAHWVRETPQDDLAPGAESQPLDPVITDTLMLTSTTAITSISSITKTVPVTTVGDLTEKLGLIALPPTITQVEGRGNDSSSSTEPTDTENSAETGDPTVIDEEGQEALTLESLNIGQNGTISPTISTAITHEIAFSTTSNTVNIPLLIGVEQLGDGYPATAMRRGFTAIPSQLALGSTWNPPLVQAVGAVVGRELKAVGVNLLLGPSLDVTNQPRTDPVGALGVHTFGGDPYWVGKMGSAYIAGIHEGSAFQLATIARHFPGQGDIDRLPEQEVATVQQSLPELQRIALPPFWQVTQSSSRIITPTGDVSAVDGLMTSHMRFSAFQGTSSTRIPPISLMPDLSIVLDQEGFTSWHNEGGVFMTNALGFPAIRRYYEAPLQEFPYRRVALDAFVAGHDLIYLAQLSADNFWVTENAYIQDVIQFFHERYQGDPEFQVQVNRAVRRILRLKLGLYRNTSANQQNENAIPTTAEDAPIPESIISPTSSPARRDSLAPLAGLLVDATDLAIFAENSEHRQQATATIGQVAREAVSILNPDLPNVSDILPEAPQENDQLLIFSDSRLFYECESCTAETTLGPEEIKTIITRLYGSDPGATGQVMPDRVFGRSFVELAALLNSALADNNDDGSNTAAAPVTATTTLTDIEGVATNLNAPTTTPDSIAIDTSSNSVAVAATPISGEEGDSLRNEGMAESDPNARLQQLINESNWIIFAMLDVDPIRNPASDVVKQFLRQQSERLGDKKIIVLALNAPYFLDSTEISKLTAYFGVYSKTQPFLESAIRALFRSYTPTGSPAVSVPGTRFRDLAERLSPDPQTDLLLSVSLNDTPIEPSPENNAAAPIINIGSVIRLQVDRVLDHNGHPVPDGVPVQFHLAYENPEMTIPLEPTLTRNGNAIREVIVEQTGRLLISASAGDATTADVFALRIQDPIAEATANAMATDAEEAQNTESTATAPVAPTVASTSTNTISAPEAGIGPPPLEGTVTARNWATLDTLVIAMLTILVTLSMLLILQLHILPRSILVHNMLWATICGLAAYILFALGLLPGAGFLLNTLRLWSAAVVVFIGMLLPLLWLRLRAE